MMGEFVDERRRDPFDLKGLLRNQFGKFLAFDGLVGGKRTVTLNAGEVVEVAPDVVALPLAQVKTTLFIFDYQIVEIPCPDLGLGEFHRPFRHCMTLKGEAMGLQGTKKAIRVLGCAVQGTELHQGLVVPSGMLAVEQGVGQFGENLGAFATINRCIDIVKT